MLGYGMPELLFILALALIVFGPQKLPEVARTIGKALANLRQAADDFRNMVEEEARAEVEKNRLEKEGGNRLNTEVTAVYNTGTEKDSPGSCSDKGT